jgi:hypothetical protein
MSDEHWTDDQKDDFKDTVLSKVLEEASNETATWPKWKRAAAGLPTGDWMDGPFMFEFDNEGSHVAPRWRCDVVSVPGTMPPPPVMAYGATPQEALTLAFQRLSERRGA